MQHCDEEILYALYPNAMFVYIYHLVDSDTDEFVTGTARSDLEIDAILTRLTTGPNYLMEIVDETREETSRIVDASCDRGKLTFKSYQRV
jgi:hypothetical protein